MKSRKNFADQLHKATVHKHSITYKHIVHLKNKATDQNHEYESR